MYMITIIVLITFFCFDLHRVTKEIKLEYGLLKKEQITLLEWGCVTLQLNV